MLMVLFMASNIVKDIINLKTKQNENHTFNISTRVLLHT